MPYDNENTRNRAVGLMFLCGIFCLIGIAFTYSVRLGLLLLAIFFLAFGAFAATVPVKKNGE